MYTPASRLSGVYQPGEPRIGGPAHLQMGAGVKGEAASKAGSPGERSERIMRVHLFSFTVIDGNGRATSRETVHRIPSVFVGWGVPRSHEKGDPRLTRSVRLRLRWITPRQRWRQCRNRVRLRLACNADRGGLGPWYFAKALARSVGLSKDILQIAGAFLIVRRGLTDSNGS